MKSEPRVARLAQAALPATLLLYMLIALAVTYPFVVEPAKTLTAPLHADVASSVSEYQAIVAENQNPFAIVHLASVGWPDGVTISPSLARVAWLNTLLLWLGTLLLGAVATHSLLFILGMALSASIACLLVRSITGSLGAGLVAGTAFGFFPHMYLMGWAAPTYTWMWMLLLPIWSFHRLATRRSYRTAAVAGLSPLPAMFWTPYYALHVTVVVAACGAVLAVRALALRHLDRSLLEVYAPAAIIPILGLALYVAIGASAHFGGVPTRSVQDAYQESASPLMFVIPGYKSTSWGAAPYELLVRHAARAANANLYVGYSVMLFAAVAVAAACVALWQRRAAAFESGVVMLTLLAVAVVALSFVFSLPPRLTFGNHSVPMPDDLVIHVQPAFRAGQRFVMPLMGGMAVLAGVGVSVVIARLPSRTTPFLIAVVAAVVWLDLFVRPPEAVNTVPEFASLAALHGQPAGPVFQFIPLERPDQFQGIRACLLQPQYGMTLADTCDITVQHENYVEWTTGPNCSTLAAMREVGIRYVIIDDSMTDLIACASSDRRIADDGRLSVYALS